MNELYEHKKSDAVKWAVVFTLIAVLIAGVAASLTLTLREKNERVSEETQDGLAVVTVSSGHGIKLTAARMASETEYNTVLLTATVMPEDVENKSVDWTIEWQTPESEYASGKTVTDYCTVTPTTDGALTAKVRCLQPFEAYIDVKATTREGGYTAVCTVVFEGRPSGMTVPCTELSPEGGYYNLIAGPKEYVFDLNLTNEWNQVGDKFYDFTTSVQGYGEFQAQDKRKDSYNAEYYYTGEEKTILASEWPNTFLDVEIAEGKLTIRAKKTVQTFGSEQVIAGGGRIVTNDYKSGGENVYFDVTVTSSTGLTETIKVRPVSTVNSITLDSNTIEF